MDLEILMDKYRLDRDAAEAILFSEVDDYAEEHGIDDIDAAELLYLLEKND